MSTCPICEAGAALLGRLGFLDWFRCRCCGMEFSVDTRRCTLCGEVDGHMAACLSLNPEVD